MADNKLSIIFVDDDPYLIQGLKRMLSSMRNKWDMYFFESVSEALNLLKKVSIDIVITDMRMPVMDGAGFLKIVKENYPQITRIILSGYSEQEMSIRASGLAHRFLAKPTTADTIKSTIAEISSLKGLLNNPELLKLVSGIHRLPSLPQLYIDLENEISSPTPSLKVIGGLISRDISMTVKLLQLVNSAFFGLPQNISDPIQALNFLGLEVVKSLVLFVKVFSGLESNSKFNITAFMDHSLKVGKVARQIMRIEKFPNKVLEEAFIAGMLHDLGKLVLTQVPQYFENVNHRMISDNIDFYKAEYKQYGVSHCEIGAYLLGIWGLPHYLVDILAFHHSPSLSKTNSFSILSSIHIANCLDTGLEMDQGYIKEIGYKNKINNILNELKKLGAE